MNVVLVLALVGTATAFQSGVDHEQRRSNRQTWKRPQLSVTSQINCSVPICSGPLAHIYCSGPIIATSWVYGMQNSCPGSKLRFSADSVLKNFQSLPSAPNRTVFKLFCEENFEQVPYLRPADVKNWQEFPPKFAAIKDPDMKKLAVELNKLWRQLSRDFIPDVMVNHTFYPVLPVPNPFIIPGGFFQVYFYWDSYWILKGLLFCDLHEVAKGILENFAYIVDYHGFIPNSGNVQLSRRSQPPFFTQMVFDYYEDTRDKAFLAKILPAIDKELLWWQKNRQVDVAWNGTKRTLYQYKAYSNCPRPENFLEDYENAMQSGNDPEDVWSSIASACESGIDFSSRWFATEGQNAFSRRGIRTTKIVPVDLNVFMAINYRLASDFHRILGNEKKARFYHNLYENLVESVTLFWDNATGAWYDYDLETKTLQKRFYPTNIFPLLLKRSSEEVCERVLDYLNATGVLKYQGGIPSSLEPRSREQWDFPNGWAPWNHLFVESLRTCKSPRAQLIARHVARNFTRDVFNGLFLPGKGLFPGVWEKYDVRYADGRSGFGGEYPVQLGFGWTNGAVLDLIRIYYTENGNKDKTAHLEQLASPSQLYSDFKRSVANMSIHGFIVSSLVVFCVIIAIWFTYSTFFPRRARRQGDPSWTDWERASGQHDDTRRLMDEDTE